MQQHSTWKLRDFKGIKSAEVNLDTGDLTLVTGVNSSGKSSIIQSLLLLAQSIHSENELVLNGPLVRLGEASSLVRDSSLSGTIGFSISIHPPGSEDRIANRNLEATYSLVPSEDQSTLIPHRLIITDAEQLERSFELGRLNSRQNDIQLAMEATGHLGPRTALHIKSLLGSDRRQLRSYVIMQGMRPIAVIQLMELDAVERQYRNLITDILDIESRAADSPQLRGQITPSSILREFVTLFKRECREHQPSHYNLVSEFNRVNGRNFGTFGRVWQTLDAAQQRTLVDLAASARKRNPFCLLTLRDATWRFGPSLGLLEGQLVERLGTTIDALNNLSSTLFEIAFSIQYLGPLRDEPRVVWNQWNELARGLPVGNRGEYSAAVLSRYGDLQVTYTPPDGESRIGTLSEAVDEWLSYLDIGDAVSARSHGKLGVGLDLKVNGQVRDLTSVGVGVSQALPLVVGLLRVASESIFLVEQPELHLHPAAQARLADFILRARPDVALIVETHSESLMTRVRRRAAEDEVSLDAVKIIFVEPESGGSRARRLELSEFGDLNEWPNGFLSSSEEDTRAIIMAGINRSGGPFRK